MLPRKAIVIGSGFAGLSAATFLSHNGWDVQVFEKHDQPGGRCRHFKKDGFTFDMGPSWYWMPDVFEHFFASFGKKVEDYYTLKRLDPSYRIYWSDDKMDVPADYEALQLLFESLEPGSGKQLDQFMSEAEYKYRVGINKLVFKPGQSLLELIDGELISGLFKLDVFKDIQSHIARFFKHPKIRQMMEFPVLFLGALPEHTPALYSLMNYADIKLGTWFPVGGMYKIVEGMHRLATEKGVRFHFNSNVTSINVVNHTAKGIQLESGEYIEADAVIGAADYHFIETNLLDKPHRSYSDRYWDKRVMAPGCLIYYVGINTRIPDLQHHSLFFDVPFTDHAKQIYADPSWPEAPLFYLSATSVTDSSQAPEGSENLFFLIPIAAGLNGDTESVRDHYFNLLCDRLQGRTGVDIRNHVVVKRSYSFSDFVGDYNAFKGNAYGLANTLLQTAHLKPSCKSKKVRNLYYTGQLTVPGPGVPPSLISGEVVAGLVDKEVNKIKT
ncbi:MAG: phytoene desaturase family protein [Chitinophagaceae bacterium]